MQRCKKNSKNHTKKAKKKSETKPKEKKKKSKRKAKIRFQKAKNKQKKRTNKIKKKDYLQPILIVKHQHSNKCLLNLPILNKSEEVHNQIKLSAKGTPPHAADPHVCIQVAPQVEEAPLAQLAPQAPLAHLTHLPVTTWLSLRPHPHCPWDAWTGGGVGSVASGSGQLQQSPWLLKLAVVLCHRCGSVGAVALLALPGKRMADLEENEIDHTTTTECQQHCKTGCGYCVNCET